MTHPLWTQGQKGYVEPLLPGLDIWMVKKTEGMWLNEDIEGGVCLSALKNLFAKAEAVI